MFNVGSKSFPPPIQAPELEPARPKRIAWAKLLAHVFAGRLRVIARGATFARLVDLAYHTLRLDASSKPLIIKHLLSSLERVAAATSNQACRNVLAREARSIVEQARLAEASRDWQEIIAGGERLTMQLSVPAGPQSS